jgi:hypothetical protein
MVDGGQKANIVLNDDNLELYALALQDLSTLLIAAMCLHLHHLWHL